VVGRRACAAERAHAARIGVLLASETDDPEYVARMKAFTDRLVELGWIEGRNIQIERRGEVQMPSRHPGYVDRILKRGKAC